MKKLLFGLLIIAAAGGAFYLLQKKDKPLADNDVQKEWILGKWKLDSLQLGNDSSNASTIALIALIDSNFTHYQYEFTKRGSVFLSLSDSLMPDCARYEWGNHHQLLLKGNADTTVEIMNVALLNKDSLLLVDRDSSLLIFTRLK
jgi:hypothetical protein